VPSFSAAISALAFITAGLAQEEQHNPGPDKASSCHISTFCFNSGPFAATILQFTDGAAGNYRKIRLNIRFQNLTAHELILAYHAKTSALTDDAGSTYFCCKAGDSGPDTSATGIGTNQEGKIDVKFRLEAGQCDVATFEVWGSERGRIFPVLSTTILRSMK
jgi:hypothetical protein